jgi:hypothetical protein
MDQSVLSEAPYVRWLHTMRSQGDPFLQAFTNAPGQWIEDNTTLLVRIGALAALPVQNEIMGPKNLRRMRSTNMGDGAER